MKRSLIQVRAIWGNLFSGNATFTYRITHECDYGHQSDINIQSQTGIT